jgi:2-methylcitrate dehydratase PrpD
LEQMLDHVAGLRYEDLPPPVQEAARCLLFDTLGVIIGARRQPIAVKLAKYLDVSSDAGVSTAICGLRKVSSTTAAFVNGAISHDLELDDLHQASSLHAAAVLVPAAIAVGEETDASAEEIILALVQGYEIACRLAVAMDPERLYFAGFHPTTVCGAIGAAGVAASLLKLPRHNFHQTVYLAMSVLSGIMACKTEPDHYTKSYQCGVAARNGVTAARLIANGLPFAADPSVVFAGVIRAYPGAAPRLEALLSNMGQQYEIAQTSYKLYPCCRHIYPLLDALFIIRSKAVIDAANVKHMRLALYQRGAINVGDHSLRTHNARYVMAMALQHHVLRREFFTEDFGIDDIRPLMERIELIPDVELQKEWPAKAPGIVTIDTHDGRTFAERVDYPRGGPENAVSLDVLRDKFFTVVTPVTGEKHCTQLSDRLFSRRFKLREVMAVLTERQA